MVQNDIMGSTKRIERKIESRTLTKETKVTNGYLSYIAILDSKKKLKACNVPKIAVKHVPRKFNDLPGIKYFVP